MLDEDNESREVIYRLSEEEIEDEIEYVHLMGMEYVPRWNGGNTAASVACTVYLTPEFSDILWPGRTISTGALNGEYAELAYMVLRQALRYQHYGSYLKEDKPQLEKIYGRTGSEIKDSTTYINRVFGISLGEANLGIATYSTVHEGSRTFSSAESIYFLLERNSKTTLNKSLGGVYASRKTNHAKTDVLGISGNDV